LTTNKIGAIDYLLSTTNFDFIVDKIKIDYSHWELFMRFIPIANKAAKYDS
jgi:hypothetical protein